MKIVITTGIYPPDVGGPARYAVGIENALLEQGHEVKVLSYGIEKKLPTGVRHLWFLLRVLLNTRKTDVIIALDTFSVGLPSTIAGNITGTKTIIRIGGDFLWEQYTEHQIISIKDFYGSLPKLSFKERLLRKALKYVFNHADVLAFTTAWQRDIEQKAYEFDSEKAVVVANYFGPKKESYSPTRKNFIWAVRPVGFKNKDRLMKAFALARKENPEISLDTNIYPREELMQKISECYAVILPSVSDIGPNIIIESVEHNKPFICTKETGLFETLKDVGRFVDPEDIEDIKDAILELANYDTYSAYKGKVERFSKEHSWGDIAKEYVTLLKNN
ncbi:hypothetical protein COB55_00260 [Candidatus Wolfebacteria bacterium]|nr:MAG: hypothetical protein COB55_00260 [Candidatus Wolfebacteria bacterium]